MKRIPHPLRSVFLGFTFFLAFTNIKKCLFHAILDESVLTSSQERSRHYPSLNASALWLGGDHRRNKAPENPTKATPTWKLSIVVSHCDKPVSWISKFIGLEDADGKQSLPSLRVSSDLILQDITIVSKCGLPVTGEIPGSNIIRWANVGRCDHTYAKQMYEIANNATKAADDNTLVLFIKDNDYRMESHHYRTFRELLDIVQTSGFACVEPPVQLERRSLSAYHNYTLFRNFSMSSYRGTQQKKRKKRLDMPSAHNIDQWLQRHGFDKTGKRTNITTDQNNSSLSDFKSQYDSLGEWIDALGLEDPLMRSAIVSSHQETHDALIPVCYGGIFATTVRQIQQNPPFLYKRLMNGLSRADNLEEGHFAERIWAGILSRPPHIERTRPVDPDLPMQRTSLRSSPPKAGTNEVTKFAWEDIFPSKQLESLCAGNYLPNCGVLTMSRDSFKRYW